MPLSPDQIKELLAPKPKVQKAEGKLPVRPRVKHPGFMNTGRITYSEDSKPCVHSGYWRVNRDNGEPGVAEYVKGNGCHSPTYYKLDGIAYCMVHILMKLNVELSKEVNDNSN